MQGAKPLKNAAGNTPLHSEAMHCDSSASWPTSAADALGNAYPEIVTEVNKNSLTAQQLFDGGVDAEEPETKAEDAPSHTSSKPTKEKRRTKAELAEESQDKAAAVRAGTLWQSPKRVLDRVAMCLTTVSFDPSQLPSRGPRRRPTRTVGRTLGRSLLLCGSRSRLPSSPSSTRCWFLRLKQLLEQRSVSHQSDLG